MSAGALRQLARRAKNWAEQRPVAARVSAAAGVDVSAITTFTQPKELIALYRLALTVPPSSNGLEIGSHLGASSCYIAAALAQRSGTLFCVDTWNNETMPDGCQDTMPTFLAHTSGLRGVIHPLRKRSQDLVESDLRTPLHFVFIDGDHSYEGCHHDFEKVRCWIAPGGVIAFHDAVETKYPGVPRVIGEALSSGDWMIGGQKESLFWIRRR